MSVSQILLNSEVKPYGEKFVKRSSGNKDIFIISDLHIAAGLNSNSNYDGTENFLADQSFSRFIDHLLEKSMAKKVILIINGDFVDFLRIRNIPVGQDFTTWSQILAAVNIEKTPEVLQKDIIKKEFTYGLRTHDYKSVWKLHICSQGHPEVFHSLARWLNSGNELIIVKGNHDLEWYWKAVRDYLRLLLARFISEQNHKPADDVLSRIVIPQIEFIDDTLLLDDDIYIEHGHRYENFTCVDGPPVLEGQEELNLPFGSFFNRYLINQIELSYPFIDNVRPSANILPLLIRERFPLAIKMLFKYIPFTFLIIPKKKYRYALRYLLQFLGIVGIPVAITIIAVWRVLPHEVALNKNSFWAAVLASVKNLAFLSLSYFIGRLFAKLRLSAPSGLFPDAKKILDHSPKIQMITFGHTHNPEQLNDDNKKYFNTGTWIPIFETDSADVRQDKTYTFLHLARNSSGKFEPTELLRWNDDASRIDSLILMEKK